MAQNRKSKPRFKPKTLPKKVAPAAFKDEPDPSVIRFPIVGIGASAGGLEAFRELLLALPAETGMAFILVQHLDPTHESLASEIFARMTKMPVFEIKDGMLVKPNHVYVLPSNCDLALFHNILNLSPLQSGTHGQHLGIDSFFQSLALDQKEKAIGVVLSGTASDGTLGLKAIKAGGGLAIVQAPHTAKHRGMPESAIASGVVDLILPPNEIGQELVRIFNHTYVAIAYKDYDIPSKENAEHGPFDALRKIFVLLRTLTRVDFSSYKLSTILRRIQRRMMVRKSDSIVTYAKFLQDNPNEVKALYADILIHVTEFFRDPSSFQILQEQVFPRLIKNRKAGTPIRIWVPGCSTGEEAYSIAILLLEYLSRKGLKTPIQIFATDISEPAVQKARTGVYSQGIEKNVNKERLKTYFDKVEGGYKINKAVRDLCLFSRHDVIHDPPFSKLDLVSCRNLLIYFSAALQKRVLPIFHYALSPNRFLFLGRSESLAGFSKLFTLFDKKNRIFFKTNIPTPMFIQSALIYDPEVQAITPVNPEQSKGGSRFQRDTEKVALARFVPPSVTVNAAMEILLFQGRTAPCLEQGTGLPSNNLFKMARQELLHGLRTVVESAIKKNELARVEGLSFEVEGKRRKFNIEVVPTNPSAPIKQRNYVVFFEDVSSTIVPAQVKNRKGGKSRLEKVSGRKHSQRVAQLEADLLASTLSRKVLAEEFETSQEELTSANEELQSTNEELQSTNEELETSKEELQSSNEELTTVNDELQSRNADLVILSSDLSNVLNNVEIPIVIVGNEHRIRKFTPQAEKIFNLIPSDVGRPLTDINPNFEADLETMVSKAIQTLNSQESEVQLRCGQWMRIQVRPYRTVNDRIDGAVITLVDISVLKEILTESQTALKYATSVTDTLQLPLVVLDEQLHFISANQGFSKMFEIDLDKAIGSDLISILGGQGWSVPRLRQLLSEVISKKEELKDFEIEHNFLNLGCRIMLLNAREIKWQETMPKALLLSIEDITHRRTLERLLERSEQRFRAVVELAHDLIIIVNAHGKIEFANQRALSWLGYEPQELNGKSVETLIPGGIRNSDTHEQGHASTQSEFMGQVPECIARRKDGSEIPVDISLSSIKTGGEIKVTAIIRDMSEIKKLLTERKMLLEQERKAHADSEQARVDAEAANVTKDLFLATLSHELRTPLSSILSWAQLIQREQFAVDKIKYGLEVIEQSAKTQGQLIDDLLDVARIQSGKMSIHFTHIDPREPVRLAVESVRPLAEKKHVKIETKMQLKLETVWADPERLQQIVWNLVTNAIKFSHENGTICIRVEGVQEDGKEFVAIQVIDHGKGIKPDFLPKLFHRFSQADNSSIRLHGGLGLGLALVYDLIRLHDGFVRAESKGLGKGSIFTVLLPLQSEKIQRTSKALKTEGTKKPLGRPNLVGLSVMIVEDDPSTREGLSQTLTAFGAKTIQCSHVSEALDQLTKTKIDVLVSDIAMPGEDGYSLIHKMRALGPDQNGDVPSLALSAYATEGDVKKSLSAGFSSHMAKPFDAFVLGHTIAQLAKKS